MSELPADCAIGFKEWAGVCEALASGRQTLILRKGGIAEDGGGFTPEHRVFWLYPTRLHETQQGLRIDRAEPSVAVDPNVVPIQTLVVVDSIHRLTRVDDLAVLEPFHVWTAETVEKRFHYRSPGLWALGVRAWTRLTATEIAVTPEQLGCKTWVPLESPLTTAGLATSLDEVAWQVQRDALAEALKVVGASE